MKSHFVLLIITAAYAVRPGWTLEDKEEKIMENSGPHSTKQDTDTKGDTAADKKVEDTHNPETPNSTTNSTNVKAEEKCHFLMSNMRTVIPQNCTPHDDCYGLCCKLNFIDHTIEYNVSVWPCDVPSAHVRFNITDLPDAVYVGDIKKTGEFRIPNGIISFPGATESESKIHVILEKVSDITHFNLDFAVYYRVLKSDPLTPYTYHSLIPRISFNFNRTMCSKPSTYAKSDDKILGIVPKGYLKDRTTLAFIITASALVVIIIAVLTAMFISKRRNKGFYRTYVSTDENRHLTKGNDGFEPLDDSDID